MYSEFLKQEIETMQTEDGLDIVTHATLRKIVRDNPDISVTWEPLLLSPEMCVFKATAKSGDRMEIEIGESNLLNLKNALAKENPAIMAQYRAYDRAVIQLLDLPSGKVYSNNEIQGAKYKKTSTPEEKTSLPEKDAPTVIYNCELRPENGNFAIFDLESNEYLSKKDGTHFLYPTEEAAVEALKRREEKRAEKMAAEKVSNVLPDDAVLLFGKFKGMTFGEAKKSEEFDSFIKQVKNTSTSFGDKEKAAQLEALKKL